MCAVGLTLLSLYFLEKRSRAALDMGTERKQIFHPIKNHPFFTQLSGVVIIMVNETELRGSLRLIRTQSDVVSRLHNDIYLQDKEITALQQGK
jgi:hypothetical protein